MTSKITRQANASEDRLLRIFTATEDSTSTLSIIEQKLYQNIAGFLDNSIRRTGKTTVRN